MSTAKHIKTNPESNFDVLLHRTFKSSRLPNRKYADLNFSLLKKGYKYSAFCHFCHKSIQNTATTRLQTHRNVCQPKLPYQGKVETSIEQESKITSNIEMVFLEDSLERKELNIKEEMDETQYSEDLVENVNSECESNQYDTSTSSNNFDSKCSISANDILDLNLNRQAYGQETANFNLMDSKQKLQSQNSTIDLTADEHCFMDKLKSVHLFTERQAENESSMMMHEQTIMECLKKFTEYLEQYTNSCNIRNELEKQKIEIERKKLKLAEEKLHLKKLKYQAMYGQY